jgi:hypothetical protein
VSPKRVHRLGEHVLDKHRRHDAQRDFAIDAAEGQVVDVLAEGRDIGPFGGIHLDGQDVGRVRLQVRRQIEGEGCVAAAILAELVAVDGDVPRRS